MYLDLDNPQWSEWIQSAVKKEGYTDNWIFLPAAGGRYDDYLNYVGSSGLYWSSSLDTDFPLYAYLVYFNSDSVGSGFDCRFLGQSVRPVSE